MNTFFARNKTIALWLLVIVTTVAVTFGVLAVVAKVYASIDDFDECKKAGGVILESSPEQCTLGGKSFTDASQVPPGWSRRYTSADNAFTVAFPDGWQVVRVTDSGAFHISGKTQPTVTLGTPAVVTDIENYGTDSPGVLSIVVSDNFAPAEGAPTDIAIGKDDQRTGKKYRFEYTEETLVGIGIPRLKGDLDYTYVFPLEDGKELRVFYSVYGSDPRNQVETIDQLVEQLIIL